LRGGDLRRGGDGRGLRCGWRFGCRRRLRFWFARDRRGLLAHLGCAVRIGRRFRGGCRRRLLGRCGGVGQVLLVHDVLTRLGGRVLVRVLLIGHWMSTLSMMTFSAGCSVPSSAVPAAPICWRMSRPPVICPNTV